MKRQLLVTVDAAETTCVDCHCQYGDVDGSYCSVTSAKLVESGTTYVAAGGSVCRDLLRAPECLAAEAAAKNAPASSDNPRSVPAQAEGSTRWGLEEPHEHENAERHRRLVEAIAKMTPEEVLGVSVCAGVHNSDGSLAAGYVPGDEGPDEPAEGDVQR